MTPPLVIEIGQVRIDAAAAPEDAERMEAALREGLETLGTRLAASSFARDPEAVGLVIEALAIGDLTLEDWLGDRGAERVADALYRRLASGGRV